MLENQTQLWDEYFDSISIMLLLLDKKGEIIKCNKSFRRYIRKPIEHINGKYLWQLLLNTQEKPKKCLLDTIEITKKRSSTQFKIQNKWIKISIDPIWDKKKTIKNLSVVLKDVTEQRNNFHKLEISEAKYKDLVESANIAIASDDENGNLLYYNKQFAGLFGYTMDEMKSLSHNNLVHPDDLQKVHKIHKRRFHNKKILAQYEFKGIKKDGSIIYIDISVNEIINENGEVIGTRSYLRDITENKKAEENIKIFAHTIESISESVAITNKNNEIIYVNNAFLELYGYTMDEIIGKTPELLRTENDKGKLTKTIFTKTISGEWNGEILNKKKDGSIFPIELSTSVIHDQENNKIALVGIARDISEKKKFISELENALEKSRESDQLKTAFLCNISHEIRTPLNGILGFSKLIIKNDIKNENKKKYAEIIDESSVQLLDIIKDILDISNIQIGALKINKIKFDLNILLYEIYENFKLKFEHKNLNFNLRINLFDNEVPIITDKQRLAQVISNLLSNTLKFTDTGCVEFGYKVKNNDYEFFVKDTGIGIAKKLHDSIFDHFRQAEINYTRQFGGLGLGLSISKGLVNLMGGEIWMKSTIRKGSVFYFTIPISEK